METPQNLLLLVGISLYGPRWHSELARTLGMSDRHMRRLAAGTVPISPGVLRDLQGLVVHREKALHEISVQLAYAWHMHPSHLDKTG